DVYPGVSLDYHDDGSHRLEFDFLVAPGASFEPIRLAYEGADSLRLDAQGNLLLHTAAGDLVEHAPSLFQTGDDGLRHPVAGRFRLLGGNQVGFEVDRYDPTRLLVIDPIIYYTPAILYSTYVGGGSDDAGYAIAVNSNGNAFFTGQTSSVNFPVL